VLPTIGAPVHVGVSTQLKDQHNILATGRRPTTLPVTGLGTRQYEKIEEGFVACRSCGAPYGTTFLRGQGDITV
jgi:hypothetical protein